MGKRKEEAVRESAVAAPLSRVTVETTEAPVQRITWNNGLNYPFELFLVIENHLNDYVQVRVKDQLGFIGSVNLTVGEVREIHEALGRMLGV